jgi:hypothetical protein
VIVKAAVTIAFRASVNYLPGIPYLSVVTPMALLAFIRIPPRFVPDAATYLVRIQRRWRVTTAPARIKFNMLIKKKIINRFFSWISQSSDSLSRHWGDSCFKLV